MRLKITLLCLLLSPHVVFAQEKTVTINDLAWLKGCWTSSRSGRATTEHWLKPEGGTMLGISRTVAEGKTVEFEFMQIREEPGDGIFFIAKPSGQPEATFKLIKGGAREVIFENPQHDFPQRVIYRLQDDGSLLGRIEGVSKGQEKSVDFPMNRARCDE
ncbi:MAG TPA: DUF6265 family protein [Chthoniobacterales bacterium]|nr:DUF6265 family protein [Chthoniobacterales bacterium]